MTLDGTVQHAWGPWDSRLPAPCLLGPGSCLALGSPPLPLCPGALVKETRVPISHCRLLPWRALGCLRPGKVVAPHLLHVQVPRMSPHRGCHFLGSCIPCGLGLWAQGKGRFSSLLSWDTVFLFCTGFCKFCNWPCVPGTWGSKATEERRASSRETSVYYFHQWLALVLMKLSFRKLYRRWPDFLPLFTSFFCSGMSSRSLSDFSTSPYLLRLKSILTSPTRLAIHSRQHCWLSTLNSGLYLSYYLRINIDFLLYLQCSLVGIVVKVFMCYITLFLAQSPGYACKNICWLTDALGVSWHFWKIREGLRPYFPWILLAGQKSNFQFQWFGEEVMIN